jgi:hypothetical protein
MGALEDLAADTEGCVGIDPLLLETGDVVLDLAVVGFT